jgi:predicted enzyme related to lactoylglutathione lyase
VKKEAAVRFIAFASILGVGFVSGLLAASLKSEERAMERVTGVGGVFFKAKDPKALSGWYRENLGLAGKGGAPWSAFDWREREDPAKLGTTVWALFKSDTKYFAPSQAPFMINYRVRNLDRMLAQLRANGVTVEPKIAEESNGRFAWVVDPEGNKIELWEPKEGN